MYTGLSSVYKVRKIEQEDLEVVYELCKGNPIYYDFMKEDVARAHIAHDLTALPPGSLLENKCYVGYYEGEVLIAVLEMIGAYADEETVFIRFFMMDAVQQGKGIGSTIVEAVIAYVKAQGYRNIVLSYVEGNEQSRCFW